MSDPLLIDTDVLIDYLRARPEAITYLEGLTAPLLIASITIAELYAGVREGTERITLDRFIQAFVVAHLDETIAMKGGLYRRDYAKSHSVGLADAVIAATAQQYNATLVTLNRKHYPMLTTIIVPYKKQ